MPSGKKKGKKTALRIYQEYVLALASIADKTKLTKAFREQPACDVTHCQDPAAAVAHVLKVEKLDGRGLGIIATKDVAPGEIIFVEQPFAYFNSLEMCQQGCVALAMHDKQEWQAYSQVCENGDTSSPEFKAWANSIPFYGTNRMFVLDQMGTSLTAGVSAHISAPGYEWSQRKFRIFHKAMELEDTFRFMPCRPVHDEMSTMSAPMPSCCESYTEPIDVDHVRLLTAAITEAYVAGLQSAEGQKLNGDHGPITAHHVKTKAGQSIPEEYRCSVLFEVTGVTKRIKREHLKKISGVFTTNCFEFEDEDGRRWWELFSLASRFNHSCVPNLGFNHIRLGKKGSRKEDQACASCDWHIVLVALRHIQEGEEMTLDYLGPSGLEAEDITHRRSKLARRYNFVCSCELCARQVPDMPEQTANISSPS